MTPALSLREEAHCQTMLIQLVGLYPVERGNWEVDCPEMVEQVQSMATGSLPLPGRFAAVAFDCAYTFIGVVASEADALALLLTWLQDAEYPKRPVALADLLTGSIDSVNVALDRGPTIRSGGDPP